MPLSKQTWLKFILVALLSVFVWIVFTYPQFAFIDLSVDRSRAIAVAKNFLKQEQGVDPARYRHALVFQEASYTDRFLQKALGFRREVEFLERHHLNLFTWKNRFYRENEKEEWSVQVSAASGNVIGMTHTIAETAARPSVSEITARQTAIDFLKSQCEFKPDRYVVQSHLTKNFDNRIEYDFRWKKDIPPIKWNPEPESGQGKLIIGATVSGDDILEFSKDYVKIPDDYHRYLAREREIGSNLSVLFRIVFLTLLTIAIFFVVLRRNNLVMHTVKKFCLGLTAVLFILHLVAHANHFQGILMNYRTSVAMSSYLWQTLMTLFMDIFIVTISILMPALAGESLHYEQFPNRPQGSFLYYIQSSFFTRPVSQLIGLGYLTAIIMFGIQSAAFTLGQQFFGVWVEYTWMSHLTESYFPFLTALIIGLSAGLTEEIMFRIFAISLGKKVLKKIWAAVLFSALMWGFGHSAYPVYPMWFRGAEVTLLGLFLAAIYLRFGIIPVIIAHYLFDVFWISATYLLGHSTPNLFFSSLILLLLPLAFACAAWWRNDPETARPLRWRLNKHQIFNLNILKDFLRRQKKETNKNDLELKNEILSHGWDQAVVEIGLEDIRNQNEP